MGEEKGKKILEKSKYIGLVKNQDGRCSVCSEPLSVRENKIEVNIRKRLHSNFEEFYDTDFSSLNYRHIIPNGQGGSGADMINLEVICEEEQCTTTNRFSITLPLYTKEILDNIIKTENRNYFTENNKKVQPAERSAKIRSLINEHNNFNLYKEYLRKKLPKYIPEVDEFLNNLEESYRNSNDSNN